MKNNLPAIRKTITGDLMQETIKSRIGQKAGAFTTSVLDLIGENNNLQKCDPNLVIKEALKAAALDLPISKALGFAYVIPYGMTPQFQMGYKGYIQLAIRTGQYKHLNAGVLYEGQEIIEDYLKGTIVISGIPSNDKAVGYFAYMELINGFEKAVFWKKEKVVSHAKKFSKSYNSKSSPWKSDFDEMAKKTMILRLVPKYGPMSIEMSQAISHDIANERVINTVDDEIEEKANQALIDIKPDEKPTKKKPTEKPKSKAITDQEKQEIIEQEQADMEPDYS